MGVVESFCSGDGIHKTKLNKLLFYLDFSYYQKYSVSITGAQYAHAPFGPVPDEYRILLGIMEDELSILRSEEITYEGTGYTGDIVVSQKDDHIKDLDNDELEMLNQINNSLSKFSSSELSRISHDEAGYKATTNGELISYEFANKMGETIHFTSFKDKEYEKS